MWLVLFVAMLGSASKALSWDAPEGVCPGGEAVARSLRAEYGDQAAELEIHAQVRRAGDRWRLDVRVQHDTEAVRRTFELDSCEAAAEAAILVFGVALADFRVAEVSDEGPIEPPPVELLLPEAPTRNEASSPSRKPGAQSPELPRATQIERNPAQTPSPASVTRSPMWTVLAGAGLGIGGGSGVGSIVEIGGALDVWKLRLTTFAQYAFARRFSAAEVEAELSTTTGELRVGVPLAVGRRITLEPAAFVRAGGIRGRGRGGARNSIRWVPWATLGPAAALFVEITPRVGLRLDTALEVPMVRHTFTFDDLLLHRTRTIGARFSLGAYVHFGDRLR